MNPLTHFDDAGASRMVDVGAKPPTERVAVASGRIRLEPATLELILNRSISKGNVFEVARIAGIMAAKRTPELIPLCHPLPITSITVDFEPLPPDAVRIVATVRVFGRTGVEMEALTAVSVAGLTVYDMCKAVDRSMSLEEIRLDQKSGGQHGDYSREGPRA
jgi:cyclic pyranopterin phosphate synthase